MKMDSFRAMVCLMDIQNPLPMVGLLQPRRFSKGDLQ